MASAFGAPARARRIVRRSVDHRDPPAVTVAEFFGRQDLRTRAAALRVARRRPYRSARERRDSGSETVQIWTVSRPQGLPRLPVPSDPEPLPVLESTDGYLVPGFAAVAASPHRPAVEARRIAERIAVRPLAYMGIARLMAGVTDLRPTFGKGAGHA